MELRKSCPQKVFSMIPVKEIIDSARPEEAVKPSRRVLAHINISRNAAVICFFGADRSQGPFETR